MRKFKIWLDKSVVGVETYYETLAFDDDATDEEINDACEDCLNTMIANWLDTGWEEIK